MIAGIPFTDEAHHPQRGRGYELRDYGAYPLGGGKCAKGDEVSLISEADLKGIIEKKTAEKSWLKDICDARGVKVKNQQKSSYCWIHAPTHGMEVWNAQAGGPTLTFAAFDAGAMIKNGWNQGGSGIVGVEWIAEHGVCTEKYHAPMDFTAKRSPEAAANAARHKITAYDDLDPRDWPAIWSRVARNIPVSVGIPTWSHEVLITFLGWDNGLLWGIDNSWGTDYGTNGRAWLSKVHSVFDEAGAIRGVSPASE